MTDVKYPELPTACYLGEPFGYDADDMRAFADATCALREAQKESGWRPIDGAPTVGSLLLWSNRERRAFIGCWGDYNVYNQPRITHYMPISPPTPEGASK